MTHHIVNINKHKGIINKEQMDIVELKNIRTEMKYSLGKLNCRFETEERISKAEHRDDAVWKIEKATNVGK